MVRIDVDQSAMMFLKNEELSQVERIAKNRMRVMADVENIHEDEKKDNREDFVTRIVV